MGGPGHPYLSPATWTAGLSLHVLVCPVATLGVPSMVGCGVRKELSAREQDQGCGVPLPPDPAESGWEGGREEASVAQPGGCRE